jgi:hypothetical protein
MFSRERERRKKRSRAPPIAQFVNAAHDLKPWRKKIEEEEEEAVCM